MKETLDRSKLNLGADGLLRPAWAMATPELCVYYDEEWGMPVRDEQGLFERLSLEAFQAGLSWRTIFERRAAFRDRFAGFDPERVAAFDEAEVQRLKLDAAIIRHEGKIRATIQNAKATLALREQGGLAEFLWSFQPAETPMPSCMEEIPTESPESHAMSRALKKLGFRFVGPTSAFALMEAVGMVDTHLMGSHRRASSGVWPA